MAKRRFPYFTVWQDHKAPGWRFTFWSGGRCIFQSCRHYTRKSGAVQGCKTVMSCFAGWAGGVEKEVFDTSGTKLN